MIIKSKNICKLTDNISKYSSQIDDIIKNGDLSGKKTEGIINDMLKTNKDLLVLNNKYGGNHGIDHLFMNKKTGELWIVDSKQIAKSKTFEAGAMKVIENAAQGARQLSSSWIGEVAIKLNKKEQKIIREAIKNQTYKTAIAGINKETKEILFLPINIKNKK